jgi:soluble calcium-activated nucleotidase 1
MAQGPAQGYSRRWFSTTLASLLSALLSASAQQQFHVGAGGTVHSALYFPTHIGRKTSIDRGALLYEELEYPFAIVTDQDEGSRDPQKFEWTSYLRKGALVRVTEGEETHFAVRWQEPLLPLRSKIAMANRSMELSELVQFNHLLLGFCDITGIVFKIIADGPRAGDTYLRHAIADGDGDRPKPFKTEWATVKDGTLWLGSPGLEWTLPGGKVLHHNPMWVKTMDMQGSIQNIDWRPVYQALRTAANATAPGYLWHEAVHWDPLARRWVFLPRKASTRGPYDPKTDERLGTNLLLLASEDFREIATLTVGPLEPEWGFTAVRKLPGSADVFMATKVREIEGEPSRTKLCVFDLSGRIRSVPAWIDVPGEMKYEGLEFL